jgi:fluoride exporter
MTASAQTWILVGIAGAVGTLLRYSLGGWLARMTGGVFPWETFLINVTGCLIIGGLAAAFDRGSLLSPPIRMALMVGLLGGFTTYSSFALEALRLAQGAEWSRAASYVLLTNVIGLAAVWLGFAAVSRLKAG